MARLSGDKQLIDPPPLSDRPPPYILETGPDPRFWEIWGYLASGAPSARILLYLKGISVQNDPQNSKIFRLRRAILRVFLLINPLLTVLRGKTRRRRENFAI